MKRKACIVVGLGYGDEGKGLTTDYLCLHASDAIVVRHNGGHQAGHTVMTTDGKRHVFSNFGSGVFRHVPTYWSRYCTFCPGLFLEEYLALGGYPRLYLDKHAPVVTHYDLLYNRSAELSRGIHRHGSCGVGFGATLERNRYPEVSLTVQDLFLPSRFRKKLSAIRKYYTIKFEKDIPVSFDLFRHDQEDQAFERDVELLSSLIDTGVLCLAEEADIFSASSPWRTYIFEGAQGVLLDIRFGTWPHVTKSNTTSENALCLLSRHPSAWETEIYYVTRAYLTRHGAGPFPDYPAGIRLQNNQMESNHLNTFQGEFRISYLHIDLLNYAIGCDNHFSSGVKKNLIVTCLDQLLTSRIPLIDTTRLVEIDPSQFPRKLDADFASCLFSFSPHAENI